LLMGSTQVICASLQILLLDRIILNLKDIDDF